MSVGRLVHWSIKLSLFQRFGLSFFFFTTALSKCLICLSYRSASAHLYRTWVGLYPALFLLFLSLLATYLTSLNSFLSFHFLHHDHVILDLSPRLTFHLHCNLYLRGLFPIYLMVRVRTFCHLIRSFSHDHHSKLKNLK